MRVAEEIVVELQKARLMALMRRMARFAQAEDADAFMLVGLAVGLRLAADYPSVAVAMLMELGPPQLDDSLAWVVRGSTTVDPDEPVN